jgi:hypothetical protein
MKRTWIVIGMSAVLCALLAASPGLGQAAASSDVKKSEEAKQLEEIQKQLSELKKEVSQAATVLGSVGQELRSQRTDAALRAQSTQSQVNELKDEVSRLRNEVSYLRQLATATTREAGSPPEVPLTPTGRVEMINTYPEEVAIVVNRRTYRISPKETRLSEPIPAGTFTYEVLGYRSQQTRDLRANAIYTIWVRPQ